MKLILLSLLGALISFTVTGKSSTYEVNESPLKLGKNIITVSPIHTLLLENIDYGGEITVGFNLSYERIFLREYIGFKVPFTYTLENPHYYIMPTIKVYPFKQNELKFAFGPQFYIGTGEIKYWLKSNYISPSRDTTLTKRKTQMGFGINASINFTPKKHLFLGVDSCLGFNFYDSRAYDRSETINQIEYVYQYNNKRKDYPIFQINFSIGYRF